MNLSLRREKSHEEIWTSPLKPKPGLSGPPAKLFVCPLQASLPRRADQSLATCPAQTDYQCHSAGTIRSSNRQCRSPLSGCDGTKCDAELTALTWSEGCGTVVCLAKVRTYNIVQRIQAERRRRYIRQRHL